MHSLYLINLFIIYCYSSCTIDYNSYIELKYVNTNINHELEINDKIIVLPKCNGEINYDDYCEYNENKCNDDCYNINNKCIPDQDGIVCTPTDQYFCSHEKYKIITPIDSCTDYTNVCLYNNSIFAPQNIYFVPATVLCQWQDCLSFIIKSCPNRSILKNNRCISNERYFPYTNFAECPIDNNCYFNYMNIDGYCLDKCYYMIM